MRNQNRSERWLATALVVLAALAASAPAAAQRGPCDPPFPLLVLDANTLPDGSVTLGWTEVPEAFQYEIVVTSDTRNGTLAFVPAGQTLYVDRDATACEEQTYRVIAHLFECPPRDSNPVTVKPVPIAATHTVGDFDGDAATDLSVFRPSNRTWRWLPSGGGNAMTTQWGASGDVATTGDFDGDGRADPAIFRPSTQTWWIDASCADDFTLGFGAAGDLLVPADYTGDGRADVAVFRPSTGEWFVLDSQSGQTTITPFGQSGDVPVPADYDADGEADLAVFRPSTGDWWIQASTAGQSVVSFGVASDMPVPADYDGDGKADVAIFRPDDGDWWVRQSSNGQVVVTGWGLGSDQVAPGDYDGDGKADRAIFRDGEWWVLRSSGGQSVDVFGMAGDLAVPRLALQPAP